MYSFVIDVLKELLVPYVASIGADGKHAGAVDREKSSDRVELRREDLQHNHSKREL